MSEISIILRDAIHVTPGEFRALESYSHCGNLFTVIQRRISPFFITARFNRIEYIFDSEALLMYKLIYNNILAQWETEHTRHLSYYEEFRVQDSLYIVKPYSR